MIVQVNTATYIKSELLLDTFGAPVTTKITTDWTKTATLLGVGTTATPTITHDVNGEYDILCTFPTVGVWKVSYSVVVDGQTVLFDPLTVQVLTAAQIDPAAALAGAVITAGGPVAQTGDVILYRGDAYADTDDRTLPWTIENATTLRDLTDNTITLYATCEANKGVTLIAAGTVITPTGDTRRVEVEVESAQTLDLLDGEYDYSVVATVDGDRPITLVAGTLTVVSGGRPPRRR